MACNFCDVCVCFNLGSTEFASRTDNIMTTSCFSQMTNDCTNAKIREVKAQIQIDVKELNRIKFNNNKKACRISECKDFHKFNKPFLLPINIKVNRRFYKRQPKVVHAQIQGISEYVKSFNTSTLLDAAIGSIPYVGLPTVASRHGNKISSKLSGSLDLVNSLLTQVNAMFSSVSTIVTASMDWISNIRRLFISLVNVYFAQPSKRIASFILNMTNFAMDCGLSFEHFAPLFNLGSEKPKNQINSNIQINVSEFSNQIANSQLFAAGLVVTLFSLAYKLTGQIFDVTKAISFLGKLGKDLSGIRQLKTALTDTSKAVMDWFKGDCLGMSDTTELETVIANISLWFDKVRYLLNRVNDKNAAEKVLEDPQTVLYVEELYRQGLEFSIEISNKRLSERIRFPFEQHMKLLTEVFKKAETSGAFGNKPRVSPIIIWLYGESGVGKSGATWPLAIDLNNVLLSEATDDERKNFSKHIYFRNVEQEFWDGYTNQNVVVYDDFGQMKDGQPANPEFFEIIRTANISPYPLHMAHLEEKRKAKFTSKVGILSSNKGSLNVTSLTHPDAVNRRVTVKAEVVILPEYSKTVYSSASGTMVTRLDTKKVKEAFGVPVARQVYCFKLVDPDTDLFTGTILNYEEFSQLCQDELKERLIGSKDLNDYLETYALGKHKDKDVKCKDVKKEMIVTVEAAMKEDFSLEDLPTKVKIVNSNHQINFSLSQFAYSGISQEEFIMNYKDNTQFKVDEFFDVDYNDITQKIKDTESFYFGSLEEYVEHIYTENPGGIYIRKCNIFSSLEAQKNNFLKLTSEYVKSLKDKIIANPLTSVLSVLGVLTAGFILVGGYRWLFTDDDTPEPTYEQELGNNIKITNKNVSMNKTSFQRTLNLNEINEHIPNQIVKKFTITDLATLKELPKQPFPITIYTSGVSLEGNPSGDNIINKPKIITIESNPSGDNVTNKPKIVKLESNTSGDNITNKPKVLKMEGISSGDAVTRRPLKINMESTKEIDGDIHLWKDTSAQLLISNKILANLYRVIGVKDGEETELLNCLFIRGRVALTSLHLKDFLSAYDEVVLVNSFNVRFAIPIRDLTFVPLFTRSGKSKEASLLFVDSTYINIHSDIIKHFHTRFELGQWHAADIAMPTLRYCKKLNLHLPTILGNSEARAEDTELFIYDDKMPEEYQRITLREGFHYKLNTMAGDCGAPIIVNENHVLRKIAGIHNAGGQGGLSYGESVTQENLLDALKVVPAKHQIIFDSDMLKGGVYDADLSTPEKTLEFIKQVVPGPKFNMLKACVDAPLAPTKTDIRPSLIQGFTQNPTTKPAFLRDTEINGEMVDIKVKNLVKAAMDTPYIPPREVQIALQPVEALLLKNKKPELAKVLTFEESIVGCTEISEHMKPANRSSSPGYPWINERKKGTAGKQQWLGMDEYLFDEELRQQCEHRIEMAKKGLRKPTVWVDTLKDERRPIDKVNAGKTRVFANGPMDYTLVFRQYFLGFMAHVMENRISNEQSVGTNTWSQDWGRTAKYLQRKGTAVIAGDFSTFDGTLNSCIVGKFVDVINNYYNDGPENAMVRHVLFSEVFNSIHLCKDNFYMWTHSQPSGCPITTILNSFYNSVSMRIVYNRLALKTNPRYVNRFSEFCTMVSYGDDNAVNIADEIVPWFNQLTITEGYATIGMIYTDEGKTGSAPPPTRLIGDIAYLKRRFRFDFDRSIWEAPLDLETILEMCNWIRGDYDQKYSTLENCSNAIRELHTHDREVFEKYAPIIKNACLDKCGQYPACLDYDSYYQNRLYEYFL